MCLLLGLGGATVGVVMTAIGSTLTTPTRWSFIVNLLLGGAGCIVGFFIGIVRVERLPDDSNLIDKTAVLVSVLATGTHEIVRWRKARQ